MTDPLYKTANFFACGNYQGAINEASSFRNQDLSKENVLLKEVYIQRSHLAKGNYEYVLQQGIDKKPTEIQFQMIQLFCEYLKDPANRGAVVQQVTELGQQGSNSENETYQIIAGQIYFLQGQLEEALRAVYYSKSLEALAIGVQVYLAIHRIDYAEKIVRQMTKMDQDHSWTQLAIAWTYLSMNNPEKTHEALQNYTYLKRPYGETAIILNGIGVCQMQTQQHEPAEKSFMSVLEKNSQDETALENLVVVSHHLNKPDNASRYLSQLKIAYPQNALVKRLAQLELDFQKLDQK